jgi:hypothetical protein
MLELITTAVRKELDFFQGVGISTLDIVGAPAEGVGGAADTISL